MPDHSLPLCPRLDKPIQASSLSGCIAFACRDMPRVALAPYAFLGITLSSSIDEVRAAYKKRCLETHPDKKGGDADEFIKVQKAYEDASRTRIVKTKSLKRGPQPKADSPIMQRYKQYQLQCQREREQEEADCRQRAHLLGNTSSSRWSIALLPFRSAAG